MLLTLPIMIAGCLIGNCYAMRLAKRREILQQYISLLEQSDTRLRYTAAPLHELYADNFMNYSFSADERFGEQWRRMALQHRTSLMPEDTEILTRYGDASGSSDTDAQHRLIGMTLTLLRERLDDAERKIAQKSRLYRVCGFSAGMCVALLML